MANKVITLMLLLLVASPAYASDIGCGRDTDRNGSVDNACPTPDADKDGQASVLGGGNDCNDSNSALFDGIATIGDSAGTFKYCTSGVLSASAANSTYSCKAGSGTDRWVDPNVTDCGHAGTYADPNDYRCHYDTGMTGYVAPVADDCIILKYGTDGIFDHKWGSTPEKMFYSTLDGTAGHPIRVRTEPGKLITIEGQGVSPATVQPMYFNQAQYWDVAGNDAGGYSGLAIHGNYAEAGIYNHDSDNNTFTNVYVYRVDGPCGAGECGAIKVDFNSDDVTIQNSQLENTYAVLAPTNANSSNIFVLRGKRLRVLYNTLLCDDTSKCGHQLFFKHCETDGDGAWIFRGNMVSKGAGQLSTSCGGATIDHNLFLDPPASDSFAISFDGGNGATYFQVGSLVEYNTLYKSPAIQLWFTGSYEQNSNFGTVTYRKNIVYDNRGTSYPSDGVDGFWRVCDTCSDAIFTEIVTGGKIVFVSNAYFNSASQALYATVFGNNSATSSGSTYANFSAWDATSYSTSEINEDQQLDSDFIARSTNTLDWGWFPANTITVEAAAAPRGSFSPRYQ